MKTTISKKQLILLLLLLTFLFAGCTIQPVGMREGFLFTSIEAPLTTDFNNTRNDPSIIKVSARKTYWFNIPYIGIDFAWGKAGIKKIAEQGGIEEIAYVDYDFFSLLNLPVFSLSLFKTLTVNVYGYGPEHRQSNSKSLSMSFPDNPTLSH